MIQRFSFVFSYQITSFRYKSIVFEGLEYPFKNCPPQYKSSSSTRVLLGYYLKAINAAVTATFNDSTPLFIGMQICSLQISSTSVETPSDSLPNT